MAIAFNIPSEREANEENFSRLNRLLAELYEVLCHILVARQPAPEAPAPAQDNRRDRPFSESDVERPASPSQAQAQASGRRSASSPPLAATLDSELEDDVFVSPRTDNGNDPFSTRNLDIFGYSSPRTPAGVLLSPRRERTFTFSVSSEKHWRDKGGTDVSDSAASDNADEIDAAATPAQDGDGAGAGDGAPTAAPPDEPRERSASDSSIFSAIIPDKVAGSICTALLLVLGWKLLSQR